MIIKSVPLEKVIELLEDQPEEKWVWQLLNAFASGETQKQWSRVEPLAVLCEVYQGFAAARARRQEALRKLKASS